MFPLSDPEFQLDLHRQRSREWRSAAAADHLAHEVAAGRHRRSRWHWPTRRPPHGRASASS
ncbi:hypothetical protein [Actinoplanes auranticolor]|uniref:Uncharacterized protein n=1 Tax=Actinoplanes auranticolor TaxID=47988 RepID=A0A919SFT3_9ACTN|nr:hypothetical protein [Actinoplanes auranticolor]GIM71031.1 hypothetical protein Aau02nite_43830 [Actinoplanes auranticolor]